MTKCVDVRITGRVQGVWFRKYTKEAADRIGLTGTVQNEDTDAVHCIAQGTEDQIEEFLQFCKNGSPLSKVERVIVKNHPIMGFEGFEIIR